ncbi:MAG TPA: oxidative damage protection protein [Cellvibrionales bacterium]|jgi:Fe-S cluster biosynthesis and repair protein YggX|nr:oxidative damage protection protein [Cellvibrionales bacterium]
MTRTVLCRKYQREMPGLDTPPYPGPKGEEIFNHVSRQAWEEWQKHQTMLINEKHLNMRDMESRKFLQSEMEKFLSGEVFEQVEGFVPPEAT